jgi:hypothetical protein
VQAATTQLLLGPPGSEINTPGFDQPDQGDHQRLWNLAPLMPEGQNYSRVNHGRKELIDHILVSAALVKPIDAITVAAVIPQPLPSVASAFNHNQPERSPQPTNFRSGAGRRDLRQPVKWSCPGYAKLRVAGASPEERTMAGGCFRIVPGALKRRIEATRLVLSAAAS